MHAPRASVALPACHMKGQMDLYAFHMAEPAAKCSPPAVTAFSPISLYCSRLSLLLSCALAIVAVHLRIYGCATGSASFAKSASALRGILVKHSSQGGSLGAQSERQLKVHEVTLYTLPTLSWTGNPEWPSQRAL